MKFLKQSPALSPGVCGCEISDPIAKGFFLSRKQTPNLLVRVLSNFKSRLSGTLFLLKQATLGVLPSFENAIKTHMFRKNFLDVDIMLFPAF